MPFKVPPGGVTAVTAPPLPNAKSWPCVSGETFPPNLSGSAAYNNTRGMPCVDLGATAASSAHWPALPFRGPNNENFTRVRGYVLPRDTNAWQWYLGWDDSTQNGTLGFSVNLGVLINGHVMRTGAGTNASPVQSIDVATSLSGTAHWYFFSMVVDRSGRAFTVSVGGAVHTVTGLDPAVVDGQSLSNFNFTGVQGAVSGLLVDYFN